MRIARVHAAVAHHSLIRGDLGKKPVGWELLEHQDGGSYRWEQVAEPAGWTCCPSLPAPALLPACPHHCAAYQLTSHTTSSCAFPSLLLPYSAFWTVIVTFAPLHLCAFSYTAGWENYWNHARYGAELPSACHYHTKPHLLGLVPDATACPRIIHTFAILLACHKQHYYLLYYTLPTPAFNLLLTTTCRCE